MTSLSQLSRRSTLGMFGSLAAAVGGSAAAEPTVHEGPIIDVRSAYGAIGDGMHDDTEALQKAIEDVSLGRKGGIILLQAGVYRITRTLNFPVGAGGGVICGTGCYVGDPRTKKRTGPHTVIVWDGEPGGTMLAAEGNLGWKISNISFVGNAVKGGVRRAGAIYHCKWNKDFGSGEGLFQSCWFVDAETAIKMGQHRRDDGCADYVFIQVGFMFCDVGVYVSNVQGVNYNFLYLAASWCNSVIVAAEGGHFYIQNAQIVGCGDSTKNYWAFDFRNLNDNASVVSINGLRVEQRTRGVLKASGTGRVTIVGYEEAQINQATTMFELSGVSTTISHSRAVTHSRSNPHISLAQGAQPSRFVGTDIFFDSEDWQLQDWLRWTSNSSATVERCFYSNRGTSIPFWSNDPLIGPAVLSGQTDGGREVELTILGRAGLYVPRQGPSKILSVQMLATNTAAGETAIFEQQFLLSNEAATKLPSDFPSSEGKWGSLDVRLSEDRTRVRFFVRPSVKESCSWRCLVEVRGI